MVLVSLASFTDQFHSLLASLNLEETTSLQSCINCALQVIAEHNKEPLSFSECFKVIGKVTQCFVNCPKIQRAIQGIFLDLSIQVDDEVFGPIEPPPKRRRIIPCETVVPMDVEEATGIDTDQSPSASVLDPWVEYARDCLLVRILLRNLHDFLPFDLLERISERAELLIAQFEAEPRLPGISASQIDAVTSHVRKNIKNKLESLAHVDPSLVAKLFKGSCINIGLALLLMTYVKGIEPLCDDERNIEIIRFLALSEINIRPVVQEVLRFPFQSHLLLLQTLKNILTATDERSENEMRVLFSNRPGALSFVLDFSLKMRELRNERDLLLETYFGTALFQKNPSFIKGACPQCLKCIAQERRNLAFILNEPTLWDVFFFRLNYFTEFEVPYSSEVIYKSAHDLHNLYQELKLTFFELEPKSVDDVLYSVVAFGIDLEKTLQRLVSFEEAEKINLKKLFSQNGYPYNTTSVIQFLMLDANRRMYFFLLGHDIFKFNFLFYCSEETLNKLNHYAPQHWGRLINLLYEFRGFGLPVCDLDNFVQGHVCEP